ncbi:Glutamate decarboxylase 1, partial [Ophiophagus hannah]
MALWRLADGSLISCRVVDILLTYVKKTFDRSTKVLDFHHPHQLLEGMEGFNLELSDNPESLEQILFLASQMTERKINVSSRPGKCRLGYAFNGQITIKAITETRKDCVTVLRSFYCFIVAIVARFVVCQVAF